MFTTTLHTQIAVQSSTQIVADTEEDLIQEAAGGGQDSVFMHLPRLPFISVKQRLGTKTTNNLIFKTADGVGRHQGYNV